MLLDFIGLCQFSQHQRQVQFHARQAMLILQQDDKFITTKTGDMMLNACNVFQTPGDQLQ